MGLSYKASTLPYTQQRPVAAFGAKMMGVLPIQGGTLPGHSNMMRVLSGHSAAYIIQFSEQEVVLIDAGMEQDAGNLRATLAQMDLDASAVQAVFVTHGHIDHAAGAHVFTEARVYAHPDEHGFISGKIPGAGPVNKLVGKLPQADAVESARLVAVEDRQEVTFGDVVVRAHAMPGHTTGSLAYQIGDVLFVGDGLIFDMHGAARLLPNAMTIDAPRARESIAQLVHTIGETEIKLVVPSHSGEGTFAALREFVALE